MWKIVSGQWQEIEDSNERADYSNSDSSYRDWIELNGAIAHVKIRACINQGQLWKWKAEIITKGNAPNQMNEQYSTTVYIDRFPDVLSILRDLNGLEALATRR